MNVLVLRRFWGMACALFLFALLAHLLGVFPPASQGAAPNSGPKYIFIFLADGAGIADLEITRLYTQTIDKQGLNITDKVMKEGQLGMLTTHSADSPITYSAEAATALANGCKAHVNAIGICADGTVPKTILEVAKEKGMRIGIVSTAEVYDASPAGFTTHVSDRRLGAVIADRYLEFGPDLLFGGGRDQFLPRGHPGSRRTDDKDLIALFKQKGYAYAADKKDLLDLKVTKALGLFSFRDMNFEIDKRNSLEPSLTDMTRAALRIMQSDLKSGFVLFIENEHIDSAGHFTDVAALIHEYKEFDRAVGLAYDFYQRHPSETLLLVTSDHDTGGLNMSSSATLLPDGRLSISNPSWENFNKIAAIQISLRKASENLGRNPTLEEVKRLMADHFKGFALPPEIAETLSNKKMFGPTFFNKTAATLGAIVAHNTHAYWSTSGHTNQPVYVAALGVGADRFRGYQDNTDFAKHLFALLGKNKP